jgi:glycogen operon protein
VAPTVIYEAHVKGLTARHPDLPPELRGTYAGIAHPLVVDHLRRLGVTAVELMPVHQFVHDSHLLERGLRNYWGYNTIGFLAPHNEYASAGQAGAQVQEVKQMVKSLHEAGIEVILDVVYNHTAEGNHLGPTLSFKGIDNAAYYRLVADDPRYYFDYTGTGNSLNMRHPHVLQLVMDSLRYWVTEMHVDGFRFDLASTLARELHEVDRLSAFFDLIQQDPVVSQVKLIAEPWDVGEGGYQVGNFPPYWSEWNGKYRDCVRDYWRSSDATIDEFASRFCGSQDLYETTGRKPFASVNFVTAHDGFTLRDLVSFNEKHNEANGEENRDGESHNRSWNCGEEGPSLDPEVTALRARQQRNFFSTLLLSQGVPMILHGDEIGRTQCGNNNAYCQDNDISWVNWEDADWRLFEFVADLVRLRRDHPVFRRRRFFLGRPIHGEGVGDIGWYRPDGERMSDEDWQSGFAKSLAVYLNGDALDELDAAGEPVRDASFLLLFNAHYEPLEFTIPQGLGRTWAALLRTSDVPADRPVAQPDSPVAPEEARRLDELYQYEILDTDPEPVFDDLTRLAANVCHTPVALLALLDRDREWFKSRVGVDATSAPREATAYDPDRAGGAREAEAAAASADTNGTGGAAASAEVFEVSDAAADERLARHPLVAGDAKARFVAGVPLFSPAGNALGALYVADADTRTLDEGQKEALRTIARQIVTSMELRRQIRRLAESARTHADVAPREPLGFGLPASQTYEAGSRVSIAARAMVLLQLVG